MPIGLIIGGLVGSAVGSFIPFIGAALGFSIGSLLGQAFFAKDTQITNTAPRLEDKSPAVSNIVGSPIPIVYGTARVPGSIIWSDEILEIDRIIKTETGGSIGGKTTVTTVIPEYFLDFACAICEGPILGIKKIWANSKLIYDIDGDVIQEKWLSFKLYLGGEGQTPDPYTEERVGVGQVPAYRGLAYIVFHRFALKNYANKAPSLLEFEVIQYGNTTGVCSRYYKSKEYISQYANPASHASLVGLGIGRFGKGLFIGTPNTGDGYAAIIGGGVGKNIGPKFFKMQGSMYRGIAPVSGANTTAIRDGARAGQRLVGQNTKTDLVTYYFQAKQNDGDGDHVVAIHSGKGGGLLGTIDAGQGHYGSFIDYVPQAFVFNTYIIELEAEATYEIYKFIECDTANVSASDNATHYYFVESDATRNDFSDTVTNFSISYDKFSLYGASHGVGPNIRTSGSDNFSTDAIWWSQKDDLADPREHWLLYSFNRDSLLKTDGGGLNATLRLSEFLYLDINSIDTNKCAILGIDTPLYFTNLLFVYVKKNGDIWVIATYDDDGGNSRLIAGLKPNLEEGITSWYSEYPNVVTAGSYPLIDNVTDKGVIARDIDTYFLMGSSSTIKFFNFSTRTWGEQSFAPATQITQDIVMAHLGDTRFILAGVDDTIGETEAFALDYIDLYAVNQEEIPLDEILEDIGDRVNFGAANMDASQCEEILVPGYVIRERSPARQSIEEVNSPFFVDPVISDWVLKFVVRGNIDTPEVIDYNDLGCTIDLDNFGDVYNITLPEENTLPKQVDFRYLGIDNNYQVAHQKFSRHSIATNSEDKQTINSSVILTDEQAKDIVNKYLVNTWVTSKKILFSIPKKYDYLEPTDLIQITNENDLLIIARIVEINKTSHILEVSAEFERHESYIGVDQSDFTAIYDTRNAQKIPLISVMIVFAFESLPIYDMYTEYKTNDYESYVYLGGSGYFDNWPGGTIHVSTDGENYSAAALLNIRSHMGVVEETSRSLTKVMNPKIIDKDTTITVSFASDPGLTSITHSELMEGGKNVIFVYNDAGGELISAQTVTNDDNLYTFSNLLRGRYGSDYNIPSHFSVSKEGVIVVDNTNVLKTGMTYGIYDVPYYYKGVTTGSSGVDVEENSTTYRGIWNDTNPCTDLNVEISGSDLEFTWTPVSNYNPDRPFWLPELTTDKYKIEIYDSTETTLIRTEEDIEVHSYTYSAADMVTDSTSTTDTLVFIVYRYSNMKEYDVRYSKIIYAPNVADHFIKSTVTSEAELFYWFNDDHTGSTVVDFAGNATNPNLSLTGSFDKKHVSFLTNKNKSGTNYISSGMTLETVSTDAGASATNFSFLLCGRFSSINGDSLITFFTRETGNAYGAHEYILNVNTSTSEILLRLDTEASGYALPDVWVGDPFFIVVTVDNVEINQNEILYVDGEVANSSSASTFISGWADDFILGDIDSTISAGTELDLEMFAYWDYKLSQNEVTRLYERYKEIRKK